MERPQYDRSLRHTACSASYASPEHGSSSSNSSSSDTICDGNSRHSPEKKRLHSSGSPLTRDNDKDPDRRIGSRSYTRTTAAAPPIFAQPAGPLVQTNNRLTEDYSRKVHCYISQVEDDDDTAPSDQAPPPLLPPMESSASAREMPFWRPPRVLQREPHYNYLGSPPPPPQQQQQQQQQRQQHQRRLQQSVARRTRYQQTGYTASAEPHSAPGSSLSPALLAISNSHYKQQLQQDRQIESVRQEPRARPSKPTIQSLLTSTASSPAPEKLEDCCGGGSSAPVAPSLGEASSGIHPSDSDYEGYSNDMGDRHCVRSAHHYVPGVLGSIRRSPQGCRNPSQPRTELRLPPIGTCRSGPEPCCADSSRESMSIASLVGMPEPDDVCVEHTAQPVCLPGISCLKPSYTMEQHTPSALALQPAGAVRQLTPPRSLNEPACGLSPKQRKRLHGETSAAMALQKMARTESQTFASASLNPGKRIAVSSLRTLQQYPLCPSNQVLITCYYAAVAQKSYGGEKRFLCPPPAVLMYGEGYSAHIAHHSPMLLSVITDASAAGKTEGSAPQLQGGAGLCERSSTLARAAGKAGSSPDRPGDGARPSTSAHAPLKDQASFNERNVALFKNLHVTGMQKAKSFRLRLDLMTPPSIGGPLGGHDHGMWQAPQAYASLGSGPVAIISKPSKKTAKARNQSSCIREGSLISLFNRINSQTFRTKYLNVEHNTNRWVAQSHNWSPLEVVVLAAKGNSVAQRPAGAPCPLYYGSEIVLVESRRNFRSPPMVIHKVERGRLVENACSPVSQMQKIALQAKPAAPGDTPRYLKADVGHYSPASGDANTPARFDDPDGSPELTFEPLDSARLSRTRARESAGESGVELDDAFCWTIVGISGFTYAFTMPAEQSPTDCRISPIPRAMDAVLGADRLLSLRMPSFDSTRMQLLLDGQPLKVDRCSGIEATDKVDADDRYSVQLAADTRPGALCIRRADGVLYHTKWAIQQRTPAAALELVACNLDI